MAHVLQQQDEEDVLVGHMMDALKMRQSQPIASQRSKRHGSIQPQENDVELDDDQGQWIEKKTSVTKHAVVDKPSQDTTEKACKYEDGHCSEVDMPSRASLLPSLEAICTLSRRIATLLESSSGDEQQQEREEEEDKWCLASLYCDRSSALLQYVKFDATATLSLELLQSVDPAFVASEDDSIHLIECGDAINAVDQALDDAMAAIGLDSDLVEAYLLAAQCSRSLGKTSDALMLAQQALVLSPQSKQLQDLLRQLHVDLDEATLDVAPQLLCRLKTELDDQQQQDEDQERGDDRDVDIQCRFQAMEALSSSPLLIELEQMMHESLHHQCASADEVLALNDGFQQTVEFLCELLNDSTTTAKAILIETYWLEKIAKQLTTSSSALVENSGVRKWIVKTLVPAVVQSIPDEQASFFTSETLVDSSVSCRAALIRDVLVVLMRLLLASGNLQRCTKMPNALSSIKLAYDLAKQLAGDAVTPSSSSFMHFEMVCADAYAVALLEVPEESGEALLLHQESLELAIHEQDRRRELRCHHFIGRALFQLQEHVAAREEFSTLLQQSQSLGDSSMECLAWYHLGELHVAGGNMEEALRHFEKALWICNATAHCQRTWRLHSIQQAMDFYSCMAKPARRKAMVPRADACCSTKRKTTLVMPTRDEDWTWPDDLDAEPLLVKGRRQAVWTTTPSELAKTSVAQKVIGGYGYTGEEDLLEEGLLEEGQDEEPQRTEELSPGPLTTHNVSLVSWLIGGAPTSPTRLTCWKPME